MELEEYHEIISEDEKKIQNLLKKIPAEYHEKIQSILDIKSNLDFNFREARKNGSIIQYKNGYENGSYKINCKAELGIK